MPDWKYHRSQFPALEQWTYLNTAEGGLISRQVFEAGKSYYAEAFEGGDLPWYEWLDRTEQVRKKVAKLLSAECKNIGFTGSVALAMNMIALTFKGEGEVLATKGEFPSATLPWIHHGYKTSFVEPHADGSYSIEDFKTHLTRKTKFLVCNHIGYSSGFRFDLVKVSEFCISHGLNLIVDATQSAGISPIDLSQAKVTALMFSCYKWMNSSYGVTAVYLDDEVCGRESWPIVGWWNALEPDKMIHDHIDLKKTARVLEAGQPNFAPLFALGASLDAILGLSVPIIAKRVSELVDDLCEKLVSSGVSPISFGERSDRSPIIVLDIENPANVVKELKSQNIFVSTRQGRIRISPHYYNCVADNTRLVNALRRCF